MKGKDRQALMFEGNYQHIRVILQLTSKSCFLISVEDTLTYQRYAQCIDHKFISQQQNLRYFDPIFLFEYLSDNFSDVVIEDNFMKFVYAWGTKVKKEELIIIELAKEVGQLQQARRSIIKLSNQLLQKDAKIKVQQQKYRELQITAQRNARKSSAIIKELELRLKQACKQKEEIIKQLGPNFIQPQSKIKNNTFFHHPDNAHQQYYSLIKSSATSAKLMRQGQNKSFYYNFVNGAEILPHHKARYKITINKISASKNIMIGFCTKNGLGNTYNHNTLESAYYFCGGYFYEGGVQRDNFGSSAIGELLECEADLMKGVLRWWKNGDILNECGVPQKMKMKSCFLSIIMFNIGDEVHLSL